MEPNSTARPQDPIGSSQNKHPFPSKVSLSHQAPIKLAPNQVIYDGQQPQKIWSQPFCQQPPGGSIFFQQEHYFDGPIDQRNQAPSGSGYLPAQNSQAAEMTAQFEHLGFGGPMPEPSNGQMFGQVVNPQQEESNRNYFETIRGKEGALQSSEYSTPIKDPLGNAAAFEKFRTQQQQQRNTLAVPDPTAQSGVSSTGLSQIPQNPQPQARKMSDYNSGQQADTLFSEHVNNMNSVPDFCSDSSKQEQHDNRTTGLFDHSSDTSIFYKNQDVDRRISMGDIEDLQNGPLHGRGSSSLGRVQQEVKKAPLSNSGAIPMHVNRMAKHHNGPPYPVQQFGSFVPQQVGVGQQYFNGNQDSEIAHELQQYHTLHARLGVQTQNPHFAQAHHHQFYNQLPAGQVLLVPVPIHPQVAKKKVSSEYGFQQPAPQHYDPSMQHYPQMIPERKQHNSFRGKQRPEAPFGSHGSHMHGGNGSSKSGHSQGASSQLSYENFFQRIQSEMKDASGNSEKQVKVLRGNVHRLAKQKVGSKFLQDLLPKADEHLVGFLVVEIQEDLVTLINDQYGNYFVSRLVEYMSPRQRFSVLGLIQDEDFVKIAFNKQGAYTLQNLLETLREEPEFKHVLRKLEQTNGVLRLAKDKVGHNVLEKIIITFIDQNRPEFWPVFKSICGQFHQIATDQHGLCILKKTLKHLRVPEQRQMLVDKVSEKAIEYIKNEYGNFIVSEIVASMPYEQTAEIYSQIRTSIVHLSKGKYSSKVIEMCIQHAPFDLQKALVEELVQCDDLASVAEDQYGNYVLQRSINLTYQNKNYESPHHTCVQCPDTVVRLISAIIRSLRFFQKAQICEKWGAKIIPEAISIVSLQRAEQAQALRNDLRQAMKDKPKGYPSSQSEGGFREGMGRKGKPRSEQFYRGKPKEEKKRNANRK